jgi:hypothetical protein
LSAADLASAPDLIRPVTGFRKWRVVRDHLSSPYIPLRWDEGVVHARCYPANRSLLFGQGWLDEPHEAPDPRCKCGIYAWHRLPQARRVPDPDRALGVVTLWGRIEVHADGMRAQHAAIKALGFAPELGSAHRRTMRRIASALGVELVEQRDLPAAALRHGGPLPPALVAGLERPAA